MSWIRCTRKSYLSEKVCQNSNMLNYKEKMMNIMFRKHQKNSSSYQMVINTKVNGSTVKDSVAECRHGRTVPFTKDTGKMICNMAEAARFMLTAQFMKDFGKMARRTAKDYSRMPMARTTKVIGQITSTMVRASKNGLMVRSLKVRT